MDDDPAARRRKLELQAKVLEGRRALQELEEMQQKEQQSLPQWPLNNHPQQHFGRVPPQPGPSRLPSTNVHGQLNMQRVDLLPQNTGAMQLDPYQWQALCAQFGQNYAGAIYPYDTYHNPNSIPTNNSGLIDANATSQGTPHSQQMPLVRQTQNVTNPNSIVHLHPHPQQGQVMRQNPNGVPTQGSRPAQKPSQQPSVNQNSTQQASAHPQQGQLVRQTQNPVPTQSLTPAQNSLQQQLSTMNQAYARNAGAEYVPPSVESNILQQSNQQARGPSQSQGTAPHNGQAIPQAHYYRPHVYKSAGVAVAAASDPSQAQASQGAPTVTGPPIPIHSNDSSQRHQGTVPVTSPPIPTHLNEPPQRPPQTIQSPSAPAQKQVPAHPSQFQPPLQRPSHQPQLQHPLPQPQPQHRPPQPQAGRSSSATGLAAGPEHNNDRVVDIPSWSTSLLEHFKRQCFDYFRTAPVGATIDVYANFQFARGFVFQRQSDGLWLVDTRDNMKAPLKQLIDELESRQVPDDTPGVQHSFGSLPAVGNTSVAVPRLPPPLPSSSSAPRLATSVPSTNGKTVHDSTIRIPAAVRLPQPAVPRPSTPQVNQSASKPPAPGRSPADANRKTLAKDILYALGKRNRPVAEPDVGPDPKRPLMHAIITGPTPGANAPAMSSFRVNAVAQGGVIDLSKVPVLPAAEPKSYKPAFAGTTSTPIPVASTGPSAPPPLAKDVVVAVQAPIVPVPPQSHCLPHGTTHSQPHTFTPVTAPSQPLLQAPQPRTAVPNQLHEDLLAPPATETPLHEPVASSSNLNAVRIAASASVPPIATIADSRASAAVSTAPQVVQLQPDPKVNQTVPPAQAQAVTRQHGTKGKGRASSLASDAASQPPPSSSSSKASRVPPTSSSPGASMVLDITSPSPRPVSRAASEAEPLFLPSDSPQSPVLGVAPMFPPEAAKVGGESGRQRAYVLIPPPSPRTKRFMLAKRQESSVPESSRAPGSSRRSSSRATSTVAGNRLDNIPVPPFTGEDVEYDYSFDQHGNSIEDPVERRLLELACTRMQAVECKWDRCHFVANSPISLLAHYKKHHRPPLRKGTPDAFSCQWSQCGKHCRFQEIRHFIKHALDSLTCPYSDCQEKFRTIGKLRRHVEKHADGSPLKPGCAFFRPLNLTPPLPSPTTLPAYLAVTPRVLPAAIGPVRHTKLLPWVRKGSSGLAKRGQPRPRRAPQPQGGSSLHEPRIDRNEDLIDYTTRYSSYISEPANISLSNLEDQEALSRLSLDHRVTILDEGTDCATIMWYADDVKEEERSPSPLHHGDPLLLRSEAHSPNSPLLHQPTFGVMSTDESEEVEVEEDEEDELATDTPDGDDSEVEAMLL